MTQKNQPKIRYTLDFDVTPHQLRHTYITNLLYAGVDPKTVQYVTVNEVNSNQKFDLIRKSILSILQTKNAYDIMPVGKMIRLNSFITQQKAPELRPLRLFYSVWAGWLIPQAGYQLLFSIQPFANVVGDYTCQDRKHKMIRSYPFTTHPFCTCLGVVAQLLYHRTMRTERLYLKYILGQWRVNQWYLDNLYP